MRARYFQRLMSMIAGMAFLASQLVAAHCACAANSSHGRQVASCCSDKEAPTPKSCCSDGGDEAASTESTCGCLASKLTVGGGCQTSEPAPTTLVAEPTTPTPTVVALPAEWATQGTYPNASRLHVAPLPFEDAALLALRTIVLLS